MVRRRRVERKRRRLVGGGDGREMGMGEGGGTLAATRGGDGRDYQAHARRVACVSAAADDEHTRRRRSEIE